MYVTISVSVFYLTSVFFFSVQSSPLYKMAMEYWNATLSDLYKVSIILQYMMVGYMIFGATSYLFSKTTSHRGRKRVLFITSLPGDEFMYFGPTILQLKDSCVLHLVCLYSGKYVIIQTYVFNGKINFDSCLGQV